MIIGNEVRTAVDLVSLIKSWVASGKASIIALSIDLHLDRDCSTVLDNLDEPVCPLLNESTSTQPTVTKATMPKPEEKRPTSDAIVAAKVESGEIVRFLLGVIIIIVLAVLIIVIIIVTIKEFKSKPTKR